MTQIENPSVTRFREYLRIPTVHPDPNYAPAVVWLETQAREIGLTFNQVTLLNGDGFAVWLTWEGSNPALKSIILNSHIDVVPVERSKWTRDPFGAEKDSDGNIYARGSQDMKCVGVQYLEAIRNLIKKGFKPTRTFHVSFVPDEEVGGLKGMVPFVQSPEFTKLNVGFALDEGIANPDASFNLYYGERAIWQFKVTATGKAGHASMMFENTAAEKLHIVINKLLGFRTEQKALMEAKKLDLGEVSSLNMTMLEGGLQPNVVPPSLSAIFDLRVTPNWPLSEAKKFLDDLMVEAGPGVTYTYHQQSMVTETTPLVEGLVWWRVFRSVAENLQLKLKPGIFAASSDAYLLREVGIPAFGFSPMNHTPVLLHDHDEFLNERVFLRGIEIYEWILQGIGAIGED